MQQLARELLEQARDTAKHMLALQPEDPAAHSLYCIILQSLDDDAAAGTALKRAFSTVQACGSEYYIGMLSCAKVLNSLQALDSALRPAQHLTTPDAIAAKSSMFQATAAEVPELLKQAGRALRRVRQQQTPPFGAQSLEIELQRAQLFANHILDRRSLGHEERQLLQRNFAPQV